MKNIFTIDTEDWFHANYEDGLFQNSADVKSTVEEKQRCICVYWSNIMQRRHSLC